MGGNAGDAAHPLGSGPTDAWGNVVPSNQAEYVSMIQWINGSPKYIYAQNPQYVSPAAKNVNQTVTPPHYSVTFDTIGQTIYRSIGTCRLPLRTIWAQGINYPGEVEGTQSPTLTFAAALCAPIDPDEEGGISVIFNGSKVIYDTDKGGIQIPDGLSVEDAAALQLSLTNAVAYPGTESQSPSPLISADKGADKTNAFRGLRYIVLPLYPLIEGFGGGNSSAAYRRSNNEPAAVEFAAGSD